LPFTKKAVGTKENIILILSEQWPLSTKEIFERVRKSSGNPITYQAVHKTLQGLLNEGVVEKKKNSFQLNLDWVEKLKRFTESIETEYKLQQEKSSVKTFDNFYNACRFIVAWMDSAILHDKEHIGVAQVKHLYWLMNIQKSDLETLKRIFKSGKGYVVCCNSSPLNKALAPFYRRLGRTKIKLGVDCASTHDTFVIGDKILQIFFDIDLKQKIEKLNKNKDVQSVLMKGFFDIFYKKKTQIKIFEIENKELASQIKQQTIGYFA